jgi:hypothetical protein
MKIEARGKLNTRKPSTAPMNTALASTPSMFPVW